MIIIEVLLSAGAITPADLARLVKQVTETVPPVSVAPQIVCVSGRMPMWAAAALCHAYHPARVVCTYEPRQAAAIVVASHDLAYNIGDVIPEGEAQKVTVTF